MKALFSCVAVAAVLCGTVAAQIVTLPAGGCYDEDFEAGAGAWSDISGTWQVGTPAGGTINAAASGVNAFHIVPYALNQLASIEATFDLTALASDPMFAMNVWYDSESGWDGAMVEVDTGGGFATLGAFGDPNWYNETDLDGFADGQDGFSGSSGGYVLASHRLTGAAGNVATVRVTWVSDASFIVGDGIAVDDIKVCDSVAVSPGAPYLESFEGGFGAWQPTAGFMNGTPPGATINAAASGVNAAHVVPYTDSQSESIEAAFDLTGFSGDPAFRMNMWFDSESSWDGTTVEMDTGSGYATIGAVGDAINWYNDSDVDGLGNLTDGWSGSSGGYVSVAHLLDGAAGLPCVKLRVRFGSDSVCIIGDGVAVDDIEIFKPSGTLPGTDEDLFTTFNVNGGGQAGPLSIFNDVRSVFTGDLVSVTHDSLGTFNGVGEFIALGSVEVTGTPPITLAGAIHLGSLSVFSVSTFILGPVQLPFGGFTYGFTNPGGAVVGMSLFLQGFVIDSSAANGNFAATNSLELQLN